MKNTNANLIWLGGWSLIAFTILFLGIQILLVVFYDYPAILHQPDSNVLPALVDGGSALAVLLTIISLLPLLLIPGSVGAYCALKEKNEGWMLIALLFSFATTIGLVLCLMRWPSINWYIALAYVQSADPIQRNIFSAVLLAMNTFLGTYVGNLFASTCGAVWFFITSKVMLEHKHFPRWIGYCGLAMGVYLVLAVLQRFGIFPGISAAFIRDLAPLEDIWLLVFGMGLVVYGRG